MAENVKTLDTKYGWIYTLDKILMRLVWKQKTLNILIMEHKKYSKKVIPIIGRLKKQDISQPIPRRLCKYFDVITLDKTLVFM